MTEDPGSTYSALCSLSRLLTMQPLRHLCPQPCKPLPSCECSFSSLSHWENIVHGPGTEARDKMQKHCLYYESSLMFSHACFAFPGLSPPRRVTDVASSCPHLSVQSTWSAVLRGRRLPQRCSAGTAGNVPGSASRLRRSVLLGRPEVLNLGHPCTKTWRL